MGGFWLLVALLNLGPPFIRTRARRDPEFTAKREEP